MCIAAALPWILGAAMPSVMSALSGGGGGNNQPAMPAVSAPPERQDSKGADLNALRKRPSGSTQMTGGTLLTGPSGVQNSALNIGGGGKSLLGA